MAINEFWGGWGSGDSSIKQWMKTESTVNALPGCTVTYGASGLGFYEITKGFLMVYEALSVSEKDEQTLLLRRHLLHE